jgi:hypothetical protein
MRNRLLAAAGIAALVFAATGIAGALDGDPPTNVGWWSQDPTAAAAPEGGFKVAGVAGQPVSVAAIRVSTPSGVTSATRSLPEADGGFVTPATALQVCKTTDPWEPANPGAYDDAPTPDCAAPVALTRDADALVWSADVGPLLPSLGGEGSLMIVPSETAGGGSPLDPGFSVTFSGAALAIAAAPGTTMPTATTLYTAPAPSGGTSSGSGSGSFSAPGPVTPAAPAAPTTPDTAPADADQQSGEAFTPPALAGGATPGGGGADQPWERLLLLVPLSAAAGVGTVYGRKLLERRGVIEEPA